MSTNRVPSRLTAVCAVALTVSGLAALGVSTAQPAAAAPSAGYQNIRINEITTDGTSRVELYNLSSTPVDISNWKIATKSVSSTFAATGIPSLASASTVPLNGNSFLVVTSPDALAAADTLILFAADGTTVDRVDWVAPGGVSNAVPAMARCGGDGTGSWVTKTNATFGTTGAANATGCPAQLPAASNVRINEINAVGTDAIEFYNSGASAVDMSQWQYVDNSTSHVPPAPGSATNLAGLTPTSIPSQGYAVSQPTSFGLGDTGDSVFLLDQFGNTVDGVTFPTQTGPSYERCVNGLSTGTFQQSTTSTLTAPNANSCTPPAGGGGSFQFCGASTPSGTALPHGITVPWPGSQVGAVSDTSCAFLTAKDGGMDMSGLAFDPANPAVLWAIQNKEWLWKLTKVNGTWVPDPTWALHGKQIFFQGDTAGATQPDTEGLTVGADGYIYVTSERDNAANTIPKDTIMQFDPNDTSPTLTAIRQWDFTAQFPQLTHTSTDANLGFEGVGFVPDSWLVNNHWIDPLTHRVYDPANYPLHGSGLFFAGFEKDGTLHIYGLNSDGTAVTFGAIPTGQVTVVDVFFDSATQRVVATCDNACSETHTFMKIDQTGQIIPEVVYRNPANMPINNFEGFAIAPDSTCVNGSREAVFADDGNLGNGSGDPSTYEHALWSAGFPC